MTRAELARRIGVSRAAVSMTVTRMIGDGLVVESAEATAGVQGVLSVPPRVLSERASASRTGIPGSRPTWLAWQFLASPDDPLCRGELLDGVRQSGRARAVEHGQGDHFRGIGDGAEPTW